MRSARLVALFVVVLAAGFVLVGAFAWRSRVADQNAKTLARVQTLVVQNTKATLALCALRGELVRSVNDQTHRIFTTRLFIRDHPEGFAGVSAADLQRSVQDMQRTRQGTLRTIGALDILNCKEEP